VAVVLGASLERDVGATLDAYAAGFEATAALAHAGHPALYEGGWHPTAVCGTVGAAVAAGHLLGLAEDRVGDALGLALLRATGLRAGFGSDGKALQVGMAAAAGVQAARLAQCGARVPFDTVRGGEAGFERTFGFAWPAGREEAAVRDNWIKAYPCCLATHSSIEAALEVRRSGPLPAGATVTVHPIARAAAARDDVSDGLQAKFSISYLTAFALLQGAPGVRDFDRVDEEARALARHIEVRTDPTLGEMEVILEVPNLPPVAVEYALGSPARPMDDRRLCEKVRDLAGDRLDGVLDDRSAPAARVIAAAGLS
jgi:2-methylcitrate dehydratase PrpD